MAREATERTAPSSRVLVVGLDMGDGGLIRHWSHQGRLPNFAALMASGSWIELESPARVLHTSTWPTFATGVLPGKHGVYYPYQPKPGYQLARHIEADQYGTAPFWQLADQRGIRCLVYDVPETFPEIGFQGRAVFDWGTWAWYGVPSSQPASLLKEMRTQFGPYPLGFEAKRLGLRQPDASLLEKRLLRSIEYKCRTLKWLLDRESWDLTAAGFCETHAAGHYLWPAAAKSAEECDARSFEPLLNVYAVLDRALGDLRDGLPSGTTFMVTSGDGLRPNHCGWHLLPQVLERLGYSVTAAGSDAGGPPRSLLGRVKRLLPEGPKRKIADSLPWWLRNRIGTGIQDSETDWSRTRAFCLPTDLEGCIRINLKGREPYGIVEPGGQYEDLCNEIQQKLQELTIPSVGIPATERVWIRNEVFPGDRQEHLPDLMVTWNDNGPITSLGSHRIGLVEGKSPDRRPGTHSPFGFLIAAGGHIPHSGGGDGELVDVAPTILKLMGLDAVPDMDGTPLVGLLQRHVPV